MSSSPPSDPTSQTIAYYDGSAEAFAEDTLAVDMSDLYQPFLAVMPDGAHILDAGCGPGRDAAAFARRGYRVTAFDASTAMAAMATSRIGAPVAVLRFDEIDYEQMFDAIWACASLLHVPMADLPGILQRLWRALKPGGILYASFRYGNEEQMRGGRWFTDLDETSVHGLLGAGWTIVRVWRTSDRRPHRHEQWMNILARRR
jgi:SAM-dependent methyltransferase